VPRYLIERTFSAGLEIPMSADKAAACLSVVDKNAEGGVTWLHSYVTEDHQKTYCIYDVPNPEAIRRAAGRNGLPVDSITLASVVPFRRHALRASNPC